MPRRPLSRRSLLIGGGVGVGLIVGYSLWPRRYLPSLNLAPGEHALSGFVKIGEDGHVTVVVPQVELGHGVFTTHAQIVADELGADWRTIAVETAQPGRDYGNALLAGEWRASLGPTLFDNPFPPPPPMATGGSTTVRGFEARLRDAGAAARALLCAAAAARWDAAWDACDTHDGFVWRGDQKMRFGEVAAEAARLTVPGGVGWRQGGENRLTAQELPRLDLPSKVDGSVNFAGDIRLPDMVYAAIAEGPAGDATLKRVDKAAAMRVTGVLQVVEAERWAAVVGTNWWAASRGVEALKAQFDVHGDLAGNRSIARALDAAFDDDGTRLAAAGDIAAVFAGATLLTQSYRVGLFAHAAVETATATVSVDNGSVQVWTATQAPMLAVEAAARALNVARDKVVVHPMMVGGSFGARWESDIVGKAAVIADRMKRPVQLIRSRAGEMQRDAFRAPAAARMAARTTPDGRIGAWYAQIATPATAHEMQARVFEGASPHQAIEAARDKSEPAAVMGAVPPYDIPVHAIDHHPATIGVPTGDWRGRAWGANVFFTECFVDELAHMTGNEPFGYRMAMLGNNPRLAQCLTRATATAGWQGGVQGSNQGLACCVMTGSCIAVVAEARIGPNSRVKVDRLVAVADVGRIINPGIVRAQIIGGLIFGMSAATGMAADVRRGLAGPTRMGDLGLPLIADCPRIEVELVISRDAPGGASELAVPPVAPAIAGALFAATGVRYRTLPVIQPAPYQDA